MVVCDADMTFSRRSVVGRFRSEIGGTRRKRIAEEESRASFVVRDIAMGHAIVSEELSSELLEDDSPLDPLSLSDKVIVDDFRSDHTLFDIDDTFPSLLLETDRHFPFLLGLLYLCFLCYFDTTIRFRFLFPAVLFVLLVCRRGRNLEVRSEFGSIAVLERR